MNNGAVAAGLRKSYANVSKSGIRVSERERRLVGARTEGCDSPPHLVIAASLGLRFAHGKGSNGEYRGRLTVTDQHSIRLPTETAPSAEGAPLRSYRARSFPSIRQTPTGNHSSCHGEKVNSGWSDRNRRLNPHLCRDDGIGGETGP